MRPPVLILAEAGHAAAAAVQRIHLGSSTTVEKALGEGVAAADRGMLEG